MKNYVFWLTCAALIGCSPVGLASVKPLKVKVMRDLNFGVIKVGGAGSICVSPSIPPLVTTLGGVYSVSKRGRKPSRLKIKGEKNTLVFLHLQSSTVLVNEQGQTLPLDLHLNSPLRHLGRSGVIKDVYVGGTLHVEPTTQSGDYRGDFAITVDYQ